MQKFLFTLRNCSLAAMLCCASHFAYAVNAENAEVSENIENAENTKKVVIPILIAEQTGDKEQVLPISKLNQQIFSYLEINLKMSFDVRHYPWRRVLYSGENGEGIIFGIYKTPSREQVFNFSESVYTDKVWLVTKCESQFNFNSLDDLKGKKIGIVPGSSAGLAFDSLVDKTFKAEKNDNNLAGRFLKLNQGRMDAFLLYEPRTNLQIVERELNKQFAKNIDEYIKTKKDVFCILPKPISSIDVHFAISKNIDQSNLNKLNTLLIKAKKNGDLAKMIAY